MTDVRNLVGGPDGDGCRPIPEHDFTIRSDYPNLSPSGRLWAGHFYICGRCGLEVGHPNHLTPENRACRG